MNGYSNNGFSQSLNGITSLSDGAGTIIQDGEIISNNITSDNLSSNTIITNSINTNGIELNNNLTLDNDLTVNGISIFNGNSSFNGNTINIKDNLIITTDNITCNKKFYNYNGLKFISSGISNVMQWSLSDTYMALIYASVSTNKMQFTINNSNLTCFNFSGGPVYMDNLLYINNGYDVYNNLITLSGKINDLQSGNINFNNKIIYEDEISVNNNIIDGGSMAIGGNLLIGNNLTTANNLYCGKTIKSYEIITNNLTCNNNFYYKYQVCGSIITNTNFKIELMNSIPNSEFCYTNLNLKSILSTNGNGCYLFIYPKYKIIFYSNNIILNTIDNSNGITILYSLITFNYSLLCTNIDIKYNNILI